MKKQKVGLLTFHRCINYGSYWQARCLAEGLKARGSDVTILDHDSGKINLAEWKCAYQPLLPEQVPEPSQALYRNKINKFFCAIDSLPLGERFHIDDASSSGEYDVVVVGSDEVWNPYHPWYGKKPIFFGEGLNAKRIVSYAASFGNFPASWELPGGLGDSLKLFDEISVRDENSQAIVAKNIGVKPPVVLDPCLLFDVHDCGAYERRSDHGYAVVYGHSFGAEFIERVKRWSAYRGLKLLSVGYNNAWCDEEWIDADPFDYAGAMRDAGVVITNFFHGCVFAIKNRRPFVVESSAYRHNKIEGLLKKFGLCERLVGEETGFKDVCGLLGEFPVERVSRRLRELRTASMEYLDAALAVGRRESAVGSRQ